MLYFLIWQDNICTKIRFYEWLHGKNYLCFVIDEVQKIQHILDTVHDLIEEDKQL